MFITIGLALYSLRRIKIMRAIGNLKNEDAFRIVYKRVNTFNLDYNNKKSTKLSTVGGGGNSGLKGTITENNNDSSSERDSLHLNQQSMVEAASDADQRKQSQRRLLSGNDNN